MKEGEIHPDHPACCLSLTLGIGDARPPGWFCYALVWGSEVLLTRGMW